MPTSYRRTQIFYTTMWGKTDEPIYGNGGGFQFVGSTDVGTFEIFLVTRHEDHCPAPADDQFDVAQPW